MSDKNFFRQIRKYTDKFLSTFGSIIKISDKSF